LAYTFTILATLAVGILIGTIVSYGVKGKEGQKSSDATPLTIPAPQQLSNTFSQISKQLEPTVVNINTESSIKNPHHRRSVHPDPDQEEGGEEDNQFQDFFDKFFGGRAVREAPKPALSASARLVPASLSMPRATSLPTGTSSKRPIAFA